MDITLLISSEVKGFEGKAVQVLGVGHEDSCNVSSPLLPFMLSRFILKMGHFHGSRKRQQYLPPPST